MAAISLQNEVNNNSQTHDFNKIIFKFWKIFNINEANKDPRFKDDFSRQLTQKNEQFSFFGRIVAGLMPGKLCQEWKVN